MTETQAPRVQKLPRGGVRVETSAGPIQFGIPPETIKDSMNLGIPIPTHYIIPKVRFDRRRGINVAEFEFPAYFNFFILKRRVNLITTPDGERRIRRVIQETLFGPKHVDLSSEYSPSFPLEMRPDLAREMAYFRKNPFNPTEIMEVETLINFTHFDENGIARVGDDVEVVIDEDEYSIREKGSEVARIRGEVELPSMPSGEVVKTFEPPLFGVTILGYSHGFDPKGKTTGFVLWINRRGLMVDPPINSGALLRQNGIPSGLIDALIVTHCHADHDAGTFQKILEESKIVVMATPTVMGSFLRKYSALSGLDVDTLRRLFIYRPIRLGEPVKHYGGELRFYYSLHSIPAIGFEVYFGGKSFVFSGDTCNFPERVEQMCKEGVLSEGRARFLIDFPWHHTVILHEAGVPPLHTPISTLENLPNDVKDRLYTCHIAETALPPGKNLKIAKAGVENTIRIDVEKPVHSDAIETLLLVGNIDFFRNFDIAKACEVLQIARRKRYPAETTLISEGAVGDRFFIIASGVASVLTADGESKNYTTGDYFGETSLVTGKRRNATIKAITDVEVIEFDHYDFLYMLRGTDIIERMRHLDAMRQERSWEVISANTVLHSMSASQKTQLQAVLRRANFRAGEIVCSASEAAERAILVDEGTFVFQGGEKANLKPFTLGAFLGDFESLQAGSTQSTTLVAQSDASAFEVRRADLVHFFERNPGVHLAFYNTHFVE